MPTVAEILSEGLNKLMESNPGSLTYNGQTIVCFKSFLKNQTREMGQFGYDDSYDDLYVLVKPSSIAGWNLQPKKTQLTLDGVDYILGRSTTTTPGYSTLWLRLKK